MTSSKVKLALMFRSYNTNNHKTEQKILALPAYQSNVPVIFSHSFTLYPCILFIKNVKQEFSTQIRCIFSKSDKKNANTRFQKAVK